VKVLEDEADPRPSLLGEFVLGEVGHVPAVEPDRPLRRRVQQADDVEHCALPGAGGPDHGDHLAAVGLEIDAFQRLDDLLAALVALDDVLEFDDVHRRQRKTATPATVRTTRTTPMGSSGRPPDPACPSGPPVPLAGVLRVAASLPVPSGAGAGPTARPEVHVLGRRHPFAVDDVGDIDGDGRRPCVDLAGQFERGELAGLDGADEVLARRRHGAYAALVGNADEDGLGVCAPTFAASPSIVTLDPVRVVSTLVRRISPSTCLTFCRVTVSWVVCWSPAAV